MIINKKSDGIKIEGYRGTWYVIAKAQSENGPIFLLEHETYGEDAAALIVDEHGKVIADNVWNGFSDLDELALDEVEDDEQS